MLTRCSYGLMPMLGPLKGSSQTVSPLPNIYSFLLKSPIFGYPVMAYSVTQ